MPVQFRRKLPNRRAVTIGSAVDNDVIIDHPTVSRHHAIITRRGILRRRKLSDLNSTNGTVVNGRRIGGPLAFRLNDIVRIGAVPVRFYSDSSYRALRLGFLASVSLSLFIGGFTATKYLLDQGVVPAHRQAAAPSPHVKGGTTEVPSNLPTPLVKPSAVPTEAQSGFVESKTWPSHQPNPVECWATHDY